MGLLASQPDVVEQLRAADTERAIEEFLRVLGPTRSMYRKVAVAHERRENYAQMTMFCSASPQLTMTLPRSTSRAT